MTSHDAARAALRALFDAGLKAADPAVCVPPHLPEPPKGRTIVIAAGKAAASMARAIEDNWQGDLEGIAVTRYGHGTEWGNGVGGWREDAIYIPLPYNDAKVRELVIGVPEFHRHSIDPAADEFLILACDGVWDVLTPTQAVAFVREGLNPNPQPY